MGISQFSSVRHFRRFRHAILLFLVFLSLVSSTPVFNTVLALGNCSYEPIPFLSKSGQTHLIVSHPIDHGDYQSQANYHLREEGGSWSTPVKLVETPGLKEIDPQGELLDIALTDEGFDVYFYRDSYIDQGDYGIYRQSYNELSNTWATIEPLVTAEDLFAFIKNTPEFEFDTSQVGLDETDDISFWINGAEFLLMENGSFMFGWRFAWFDNQDDYNRYPNYIFTYHRSDGTIVSQSMLTNIIEDQPLHFLPTLNFANNTLTAYDNDFRRKWQSGNFNLNTGFTSAWQEFDGLFSGTAYQEDQLAIKDDYVFAYNTEIDNEYFFDIRKFNDDSFNKRINFPFAVDNFEINGIAFEIAQINDTIAQFRAFAVFDGSVNYLKTQPSETIDGTDTLKIMSKQSLAGFVTTESNSYFNLFDIEYVKLGMNYKLFWTHPLEKYSSEILSIEFDGISEWSEPVIVTDCSTFTNTMADYGGSPLSGFSGFPLVLILMIITILFVSYILSRIMKYLGSRRSRTGSNEMYPSNKRD